MNKIKHPSINRVAFNLAEHLPNEVNSSAPRFRVSGMKVLLMDETESVMYSNSTSGANDVIVQITFPQIFIDHNIYGKKIHFAVTKAYNCQSAYFNESMNLHLLTNFFSLIDILKISLGGIASFRETCIVPSDFSNEAYQPTPDGIYDLWLNNSANFLDNVRYLGLFVSGSYIIKE